MDNIIRFILVDFYLGEVTVKQVSPNLDRLQVIAVGEFYLSRYLTLLDNYGILHADDAKRWHNMIRKNSDGESVDSNGPEKPVSREEKIARYKREKETKKKLEVRKAKLYMALNTH